MSKIAQFPLWFVPFLFALCFHEFAHGWVARLRGDNTALIMGRLSMNPLVHMDPVGTLLMPFVAFVTGLPVLGWAKPVPVNSRNLKKPRADLFWIALAGPLSNILLACIGSLVMFGAVQYFSQSEYLNTIVRFLDTFIFINLFLAVLNLIPVHPLDGGKVLARFLPAQANYWLEQNETTLSLILFAAFMLGASSLLVGPVVFLHNIITFWARGL